MEALGVVLTTIGIFLTTLNQNTDVKFQRYKEKGKELKQDRKLSAAIKLYRRAWYYARTTEQKRELWALVVHLHTDRALRAQKEFSENSGQQMTYTRLDGSIAFWFFDGGEPGNYKEPSIKEALK